MHVNDPGFSLLFTSSHSPFNFPRDNQTRQARPPGLITPCSCSVHTGSQTPFPGRPPAHYHNPLSNIFLRGRERRVQRSPLAASFLTVWEAVVAGEAGKTKGKITTPRSNQLKQNHETNVHLLFPFAPFSLYDLFSLVLSFGRVRETQPQFGLNVHLPLCPQCIRARNICRIGRTEEATEALRRENVAVSLDRFRRD